MVLKSKVGKSFLSSKKGVYKSFGHVIDTSLMKPPALSHKHYKRTKTGTFSDNKESKGTFNNN